MSGSTLLSLWQDDGSVIGTAEAGRDVSVSGNLGVNNIVMRGGSITVVGQISGNSAGVNYVNIGSGSTSHSLDAVDDLLISGELEVNGVAFFDTKIDLFDITNTKANSDLTISNTAVDGTGNGKDIVFDVADGTDGDDNAGSYVFKYADYSGDGEPSAIILQKSGEATGADADISGTGLRLEASSWNTDTASAVNSEFEFYAETNDGDNGSRLFGTLSLAYLDDNNEIDLLNWKNDGSGAVQMRIGNIGEAKANGEEYDSVKTVWKGSAYETDTQEAIVSGYIYTKANAGAPPYAEFIMGVDNNDVIEFRENTIREKVGKIVNLTTVNAATYELLLTDYIVHVTYTATAAVTSLTLPTVQLVEGRVIVIKDAGGNANANNITINTQGAETIDGQNTLVINSDYGSVNLYSDGSNWFVY